MQPWTVIYHPVLSPDISYYSLHGFIQHEKHYFWAKLNLGFLKMKKQHSQSPGPLQNFFFFLVKVISPALLHGEFLKSLFCKNNCRDGFVFFHCFSCSFPFVLHFAPSSYFLLFYSPAFLSLSFLYSPPSMTTLGISAKRYHPSKSIFSFSSGKTGFRELHFMLFVS